VIIAFNFTVKIILKEQADTINYTYTSNKKGFKERCVNYCCPCLWGGFLFSRFKTFRTTHSKEWDFAVMATAEYR
jgi:hypothetical protein